MSSENSAEIADQTPSSNVSNWYNLSCDEVLASVPIKGKPIMALHSHGFPHNNAMGLSFSSLKETASVRMHQRECCHIPNSLQFDDSMLDAEEHHNDAEIQRL